MQQLLDSCDISDPAGVREYAILMLVARLALRSIEAARLQLDDFDWRAGRIVLRGKASREDGMPLPADVGEAFIATCITNARAEVYNRLVKQVKRVACGVPQPRLHADCPVEIEEPLSLPVSIPRK